MWATVLPWGCQQHCYSHLWAAAAWPTEQGRTNYGRLQSTEVPAIEHALPSEKKKKDHFIYLFVHLVVFYVFLFCLFFAFYLYMFICLYSFIRLFIFKMTLLKNRFVFLSIYLFVCHLVIFLIFILFFIAIYLNIFVFINSFICLFYFLW